MKIPRDVSGQKLIKALRQFGYEVNHQTGSHIRLHCNKSGEHSITIPNHNSLRIGTLAAIIADVAAHLKVSKQQIIEKL